jgi:threonine/homoserine/homoserine lactone efflux protein
MQITTWLALAALCLLGAMTPGPSLALVLRQTLGNGRAHGVTTALAHGAGVGLYALATVQGLALVLSSEPWLFRLLTWGGAGYLFWLGLQSLRASCGALDLPAGARAEPLWRSARVGLIVALSNPHLAVFFLALFSQFVSPGMSLSCKLEMVLTAGLLDMGWYALVALALSHPALLPAMRRRMAAVQRLSGVAMLLLGLRVLTL